MKLGLLPSSGFYHVNIQRKTFNRTHLIEKKTVCTFKIYFGILTKVLGIYEDEEYTRLLYRNRMNTTYKPKETELHNNPFIMRLSQYDTFCRLSKRQYLQICVRVFITE